MQANPTAMMFRMRWLKEIVGAEESKLFTAYYDKAGEVRKDDPGLLYLLAKPPVGSLYENQTMVWSVKFIWGRAPDVYTFPQSPPLVRAEMPITHPNISKEGSICLDILRPVSAESLANSKENGWQMTYGIEAIFNSITVMLDEPNTGSPFNKDSNLAFIDYRDSKDPDRRAKYQAMLDAEYNKRMSPSHLEMLEKIQKGKKWGKTALDTP